MVLVKKVAHNLDPFRAVLWFRKKLETNLCQLPLKDMNLIYDTLIYTGETAKCVMVRAVDVVASSFTQTILKRGKRKKTSQSKNTD